jgi:hypothetical protein
VEWLHSHTSAECDTWAMDLAADLGHLDVVQWLHFNRSEGCSFRAMNFAARNGHLDVVKWLFFNKLEDCDTQNALTNAIIGNQQEIIDWL